ncbi:MAG: twin-arginine translocase TatA/TatE family subunit [Elusimicrobia bacterium]|nr:twin-arginine translocase TatA/TatE family subunit [Elusimicrobiota bacterium]
MFGLGFWEIVLVLAIVVLIFGAKRLPGVARALGQSVQEFKKGVGNDKCNLSEGNAASEAQVKKTDQSCGCGCGGEKENSAQK